MKIREQSEIFKVLKGKNPHQPRILYQAKIPFKIEKRIDFLKNQGNSLSVDWPYKK